MPRSQKNCILIRPPTPADCKPFVEAVHRSRRLHARWITPKARTAAEYSNYIKRFDGTHNYGFLVIDKASDQIAGVINLNNVIRGSFHSASLGYYAFSGFERRGLMRAGMLLVLKHAFRILKLHRLEANIQPGNKASIALVKKCGFVREGLSRRMLKVCGRWQDHERWAILRENHKNKPERP